MKPPSERQAASRIGEVLADLFGDLRKVQVRHVGRDKHYDFAISAGGNKFAAEYKSTASTSAIASAINGLDRSAEADRNAGIPLIIVPFMGELGRQLSDEAQISWLDLCGNAKIVAPGLRIWIEGRPNKYVGRGRPPNLFAAKSSRITRQLLLHPQRFQTQAELARESGLGDGYVSKIVGRLKNEGYIVANGEKAVRSRDPNLLLDAWHDAYDFNHHRIIKGHVLARSGDELLQKVADALRHEKQEWAMTGLGAAWLYTGFAAFRLATAYLSSMPTRALLNKLEFSEEPKGANLWLVLPDDDGVFHGSQVHQGIPCVSAVQTYLDLKGHPERAKDAAAELRAKCLKWGQDGT